jgi:hypothetical protein
VFSRLATVRQPAAFALALALGAVAALALISCGGGEDAKLLPGATAREITENLDRVKQLAAEGECVGAADAAQEVSGQVEALGVDAKLKQALQQGTARLDEVVATCDEESTEALAPSSEATTTEETKAPPGKEKKHKVPPGQEKKAEREEDEEEPGETTEPTTPAPPAETPPAAPPSESGGTGAPGGVSPGSPVGGED